MKVFFIYVHSSQQSITHPGSFLSSAGDPDAISWCCCCCWCSIIIIFIIFSLSLLRKWKKAHRNISYSLCWIFKEQQRIFPFSYFIYLCNKFFFSAAHFFLFQKFFYCLRFSFFKLNFFLYCGSNFYNFHKIHSHWGCLFSLFYSYFAFVLLFFVYKFFFLYLCLDDGGCFWWELIFIDAQFYWCSKIFFTKLF